jgi:hypothetical protein
MSKSKKVSLAIAGVFILATIAILFFLLTGNSNKSQTTNSNGSSSQTTVKNSSKTTEPSSATNDISSTKPNRYSLSSSVIISALTNAGFSEIQVLPTSSSPLNTFLAQDYSSNNIVKNNGLDYIMSINYGNDDYRKVTQIHHISSAEKWEALNGNISGLQDGDWVLIPASHGSVEIITSISQVTDEASKYLKNSN